MNRKTFLPALALVGLFATSLPAAEKPNFSGSWKLNSGKSDFGMIPAPDKMDRTIMHTDPTLKMTTVQSGPQGEMTSDMVLMTDGSDSVNKLRGTDVKSVAKWDGDKLTVKSKREAQGMEINLTETWTMSADGKVLTVINAVSTPQGDFEAKVIMDRVGDASALAKPAAAVTAATGAGCKADFSGEWKLNADKSNFGPMPPPSSMTMKVDHKDPSVKTVTNQSGPEGDATIAATYTTDGKETKNDFRGTPVMSTAKCDATGALNVASKLDFQGMAIDMKSSWTLSADGKTMNQAAKIGTPQGDFETMYVLERVK